MLSYIWYINRTISNHIIYIYIYIHKGISYKNIYAALNIFHEALSTIYHTMAKWPIIAVQLKTRKSIRWSLLSLGSISVMDGFHSAVSTFPIKPGCYQYASLLHRPERLTVTTSCLRHSSWNMATREVQGPILTLDVSGDVIISSPRRSVNATTRTRRKKY